MKPETEKAMAEMVNKAELAADPFRLDIVARCPDGVRGDRIFGNMPIAYLAKWLKQFRPFGYATQDDTWGELEKILEIVHRNVAVQRFKDASALMTQARQELRKAEAFCDANLSKGWRSSLHDE